MSDRAVFDLNNEVHEFCKGENFNPYEVMLIRNAMTRTAARLGHTVINQYGEIREPADILGNDGAEHAPSP